MIQDWAVTAIWSEPDMDACNHGLFRQNKGPFRQEEAAQLRYMYTQLIHPWEIEIFTQ